MYVPSLVGVTSTDYGYEKVVLALVYVSMYICCIYMIEI